MIDHLISYGVIFLILSAILYFIPIKKGKFLIGSILFLAIIVFPLVTYYRNISNVIVEAKDVYIENPEISISDTKLKSTDIEAPMTNEEIIQESRDKNEEAKAKFLELPSLKNK